MGRRVPELDGSVIARRGQIGAVRTEGHGGEGTDVATQGFQSWPVAASHSFTVLSPLAEATTLLSGLKATLLM